MEFRQTDRQVNRTLRVTMLTRASPLAASLSTPIIVMDEILDHHEIGSDYFLG